MSRSELTKIISNTLSVAVSGYIRLLKKRLDFWENNAEPPCEYETKEACQKYAPNGCCLLCRKYKDAYKDV